MLMCRIYVVTVFSLSQKTRIEKLPNCTSIGIGSVTSSSERYMVPAIILVFGILPLLILPCSSRPWWDNAVIIGLSSSSTGASFIVTFVRSWFVGHKVSRIASTVDVFTIGSTASKTSVTDIFPISLDVGKRRVKRSLYCIHGFCCQVITIGNDQSSVTVEFDDRSTGGYTGGGLED